MIDMGAWRAIGVNERDSVKVGPLGTSLQFACSMFENIPGNSDLPTGGILPMVFTAATASRFASFGIFAPQFPTPLLGRPPPCGRFLIRTIVLIYAYAAHSIDNVAFRYMTIGTRLAREIAR